MSSTVVSLVPSTSDSTFLKPILVAGPYGVVLTPIFVANSVARSTPTRLSAMRFAKHVLAECTTHSVSDALEPSGSPFTDHGGWPATLITVRPGGGKLAVGLMPLASAAANTMGLKVEPACRPLPTARLYCAYGCVL